MSKPKLQYFGHLMQRGDSLEKTLMLGKIEGRRRRGWQRMVGWHHGLNGHEFGWTLGVGDGQGGLVCCGSWGRKELNMTEWLNWTELPSMKILMLSCFPRCTLSCSRLFHKCFTSNPSMPFSYCMVCSPFTDVAAFIVHDSITASRPAYSLQGKFPLLLPLITDLSTDQHLPAGASFSLWLLKQKLHSRVVLCLVAQSCPTLCNPMDCSPPGSSVHGDSPGKNTGVGCHALFQGIFPTKGSNPGLPHCGQIFTIWATKASSRIL